MRAIDGGPIGMGDLVRVVFRQDPNSRIHRKDLVGILVRTGTLFELVTVPIDGSRAVFGRSAIAEVFVLSRLSEAVG